MNDWTTDALDAMIARHADPDIRQMAMALRGLLLDLETAEDAERMERGRDLSALLNHEMLAASRGGEDFINDQAVMG